MVEQMVRTTCPYCGVGCGIEARRQGTTVTVRGDERHPANFGRLCAKGSALAETLDLEGRLLYPEVHGQRVSWDRALDAVAQGLRDVIERDGPEAVAFYGSGQLLTEDYYVANKLMKGFIGSSNIDTNSRLCMSSSVAGHQRAFGEDIVPGNYEDLEQADLLVLAGSNLAWCHPVLYQRVLKARQARSGRPRLVVIDPRRTATAEEAELHLPLRPGTDTVLFNGLLVHLFQQDRLDLDFLDRHTADFWSALRAAREVAPSIAVVARRCGLVEAQVAEFYRLFALALKTVTAYSQGVNQSSCGSDKVNSIINCHLATGRIGKPGMGPFSITGQPNAMGGREVGGLANQLAAHLAFTPADIDRVRRFWQAPAMATTPGLKAVELFQAVAAGRIKALWIMATNPVVSLPNADQVRAALRTCPLVIVSDACIDTDTVAPAHIRLPALTWGEKDGTVTNSERRISRQRAFLPPPGEARPDWWIVTQVARRLGFATAFSYETPAAIFREHAALSGFENGGRRVFDIGGLTGLSDAAYDALEPLQWPVPAGDHPGTARIFGDGRFTTPDGRARFIVVGERTPAHALSEDFPLVLNTGRVRDHWHTLTRTGKSARLSAHVVEPSAEVHPVDARVHGIAPDSLLRVFSRWGEAIVRARINPDQPPGSVFVPMHWGEPYANRGRIGTVVNPATDPLSGQPESKHTPVRIQPYRPAWQGFILSREQLKREAWNGLSYRVSARGQDCWRYELAGEIAPANWADWVRSLQPAIGAEWIDYDDRSAGRYRGVALVNGRLEFCLFIAPDHRLPPRDWLANLFAKTKLDGTERSNLLAGRPGTGERDQGGVLCACFNVGVDTLRQAIQEHQLTSPADIGTVLKAGTHCGSCVPELRKLLASRQR
ncbi:MAG: molybdopterin-dependent oxidoreductase [Candidatus Competibacteraceae bacterium]